MKNTQTLTLTALSLLNLGVLIFIVFHHTASVQQVIRGRALEIVDGQGRVRASISINPEGPARRADGSPTE